MNTLRFEKTGDADGILFSGSGRVAEIRSMCLRNLRLSAGGSVIIGPDVPLPLFWRQYAHHEDPRRNAGSGGHITEIPAGGDRIVLRCEGWNAGGEIRSVFTAALSQGGPSGGLALEIHAVLEVARGKTWEVTHNPDHGELEFCNIWPEGTFTTAAKGKKKYSHCFIERPGGVTLIPHTHIESSDKKNILMLPGDRFGWLLEDENPVVELLPGPEASAGLCAYMWDAHVGYRACHVPGKTLLPGESRHEASIRITRVGRDEGSALMARGAAALSPEAAMTPLYVEGVNTFRETLRAFPGREDAVWPWTFEVSAGKGAQVTGEIDSSHGYDDTRSIRIRSSGPGTGRWIATTLGPAFGGPPFADGRKYRLSAFARSSSLRGSAGASLRLHREGAPGLAETAAYEFYASGRRISGDSPWTAIEVITPPISPPPDRVHLILEQEGEGTTWFDNVLFAPYE